MVALVPVVAGATGEGVCVEPGCAVRIMTGAPTPTACDAVVPVEETDDGHLEVSLLEMVKKGVTKTQLESLKETAGLDYDTLAQGLSTARATLINIKGEDKFNFAVSEKIVGLEDIYSYGYEVFGDKDSFNQWMFRHNKALGNYTPFELVNNQFGREEIKSLIGRIDYGVFS